VLANRELVIVGLGNPGKKYENTRHNMGYLVVEALALSQQWSFKQERYLQARVVRGEIESARVHLVLPTTYMNESGIAVRRYLDFYKLGPEHLLVVTDDVALPYGKIRLRIKGSAGGHNGLKSIEACIGTRAYLRLKMGIGTDKQKEALVDYVLSEFSLEESATLKEFVERGVVVLKRLFKEPVARVMNSVNAMPRVL
jgi:peptidyl-tRNA hydrolase, PTH1 family